MAICSKVTRLELRAWHDAVEESIKQGLTHKLHNEAITAGNVHKWTFHHPGHGHPLVLQAPVLKNGKLRIMGTNRKHLKKNTHGSATSGARVLVLGRYLVHYSMLETFAESHNSPLLHSDIISVDRQDDCAHAHLCSSAVIRQFSLLNELQGQTGLVLYFWIAGETINAQQSRTLSHLERMKILWWSQFFFDSWHQYVSDHLHYSVNTHFITRELYDIISIFINVMLMLMLIHQYFLPEIPLLHWLSSTEICEHFFGCTWKIQKDFTFIEWSLMIPKLVLLIAGEFKTKGFQTKSSKHCSGYHHLWFEVIGINIINLATYTSDSEIQGVIDVAFKEAMPLLSILGIENFTSGSIKDIGPQLAEVLAVMQPFLHTS